MIIMEYAPNYTQRAMAYRTLITGPMSILNGLRVQISFSSSAWFSNDRYRM